VRILSPLCLPIPSSRQNIMHRTSYKVRYRLSAIGFFPSIRHSGTSGPVNESGPTEVSLLCLPIPSSRLSFTSSPLVGEGKGEGENNCIITTINDLSTYLICHSRAGGNPNLNISKTVLPARQNGYTGFTTGIKHRQCYLST